MRRIRRPQPHTSASLPAEPIRSTYGINRSTASEPRRRCNPIRIVDAKRSPSGDLQRPSLLRRRQPPTRASALARTSGYGSGIDPRQTNQSTAPAHADTAPVPRTGAPHAPQARRVATSTSEPQAHIEVIRPRPPDRVLEVIPVEQIAHRQRQASSTARRSLFVGSTRRKLQIRQPPHRVRLIHTPRPIQSYRRSGRCAPCTWRTRLALIHR